MHHCLPLSGVFSVRMNEAWCIPLPFLWQKWESTGPASNKYSTVNSSPLLWFMLLFTAMELYAILHWSLAKQPLGHVFHFIKVTVCEYSCGTGHMGVHIPMCSIKCYNVDPQIQFTFTNVYTFHYKTLKTDITYFVSLCIENPTTSNAIISSVDYHAANQGVSSKGSLHWQNTSPGTIQSAPLRHTALQRTSWMV